MYGVVKVRPEPMAVAYLQVADPTPAPDQVVIQVRTAGICGTDMSMYHWKPSWAKEYGPVLPVVMGHECAGEVVACGSAVQRYRSGDRVVPFPILYCGTCEYCRMGRPAICNHRPLMGMGAPGVFGQYVAVREGNVYPVAEDVDWDVAGITELICVALWATKRVQLDPGETVYIVGPGPVGLAIAVAAIGSGAGQVFMSGLTADALRLGIARSMGVITITADTEPAADVVAAATGGRGVDVAFEASGHPDGTTQCMAVVRKGGRIGMVGQGFAPATLASNQVSYREVDLIGVRGSTDAVWRRSGPFIRANQELIRNLITHRLPLSRGPEGFRLMDDKAGVKVLLTAEEG